MWVMSSRLMTAPWARAKAYSCAGVSLEVNITSSPDIPALRASTSSGRLAQSAPKPSSARTFSTNGFGRALTAKCSLNPGKTEKALAIRFALARIAPSS